MKESGMDTLNVLIIEDSESDANLELRQLEKTGSRLYHERVETADEMKAALDLIAWDVVIADDKLPQFNASGALTILKRTGMDIPFIVVSGTIGEETAVGLMKAGAHDYLMKDKLIRLVPAVKREIAEAQVRRERQQAEKALRASQERYRILSEASHDMIFIVNRDDIVEYVNAAAAEFLHKRPEEVIGKPHASFFPEEISQRQLRSLLDVFDSGDSKYVESRTVYDNQVTWLSTWLVPMKDERGDVSAVMGVSRDISNQKWLEEDKEKLRHRLQEALTEVKALSGLLPICSVCKKIRDDRGYWQQVEIYIQQNTNATFTHGVCPECFPKLYPEYDPSKPDDP